MERLREERKTKENPLSKFKKEPSKKPNNLNKTTITNKKNLNISTDIKQVNAASKHTPVTKADNEKSDKSVKNETPRKDKVIDVKALRYID